MNCTTLTQAADELISRAKSGSRPIAYRLVNSYTFALADQVPAYHNLLRNYGINLPDGRPVVKALNVLRPGIGDFGQVRGPSFFAECLDRGRQSGVRHFFLGGTQGLLESLVAEGSRRYPGIIVCGTYSPPFRELTAAENAVQNQLILAAVPDVVWVGLGTPKQDFEAQRLSEELGVTTAGVGAAFDFVAGSKREAPRWVRQMSMEWCFRLLTEPRRLWRRYLFGNTRFIAMVLRQRLRPQAHPPSPARPHA